MQGVFDRYFTDEIQIQGLSVRLGHPPSNVSAPLSGLLDCISTQRELINSGSLFFGHLKVGLKDIMSECESRVNVFIEGQIIQRL